MGLSPNQTFQPTPVGTAEFSRSATYRDSRMRRLLGCLLIASATTASATSPCKTEGGCIDEASASLLVALELLESECSLLNPGMRSQYSAAFDNVVRDENVEFLRKLRNSEVYKKVRADTTLTFRSLRTDDLSKECRDFLKEVPSPTDQSTRTR